MAAFGEPELAYLRGARRRLATVGKDGTPHVVPVGISYNADHDTIDVTGRAEAVDGDRPLIRIRPDRVVSWGLT